jgi:dTDP-glucose pyrophosphorylase
MIWKRHLIPSKTSLIEAIKKLDDLAQDALLFVHNEKNELIGSLTDGDVRRGLLAGIDLNESINLVCQKKPRYIRLNETSIDKIRTFREQNLKIIPVLAPDSDEIVDVINFRLTLSRLPIDVVIMAGGEGQRLRPLTEHTPKPLLFVGDKPIIEYTMDRLCLFGVKHIWLSVNYLADKFVPFCEKFNRLIDLKLVKEDRPLGTIGSVKLIKNFHHDTILVCNSDLLTNLDYEAFYEDFINSGADLSVVTIPYDVEIPYAVMEVEGNIVHAFKEKPTYTYYSNGGIYLMKREVLDFIPEDEVFLATDLMNLLIDKNRKVYSFHHRGYWLDIGKHDDFRKAQEDVRLLKL